MPHRSMHRCNGVGLCTVSELLTATIWMQRDRFNQRYFNATHRFFRWSRFFCSGFATAMWPSPLYIKPLPGSFMMPLTHWIPQATQEKRRECFWATRWRSRARNCSKLEEIIFCKCSKCAWEGAFLVITCSLVKQGSDTLMWVLHCGLGESVNSSIPWEKIRLSRVSYIYFEAIEFLCLWPCFQLLVTWLGQSHDSVIFFS